MLIKLRRQNLNEYAAIITALFLIIGTVLFKPHFFDIFPLFISIIVMFLQSNVNRYAFLLGGLNSIIYSVSYISMTLYSSAVYALLVSFPIQIATFINWSKNTTNGRTAIKRLSNKWRVILSAIMTLILLIFLIFYFIFSFLNSDYLFLDIFVTVISVASTVLSFFRYCEAPFLSFITCLVNIVLFIQVTIDDPSKCLWLVYSVYTAICTTIAFIKMNKQIESTGND